ncbi:MAG: DNA translocase FtsK [Chlamydiae bacterium]|nr:DNA translocase FtsK [Chlamydiota bacterium]
MARKRTSKKNSQSVGSNHPEILGILLIVLSLFSLLSLMSFQDGNANQNWLGYLGYALSWSLLYTFGLLSYPLVGVLSWVGWRKLSHKPIHYKWDTILYFLIIAASSGLLLNVLAETKPPIASLFNLSVYTEKITLKTPLPYKEIRVYLGGYPLYYLYTDLPKYNLARLLSNVGITLIFSTTCLVSILLLTQLKLSPIIFYFQDKLLPKLNSYFTLKKLNSFLILCAKMFKKALLIPHNLIQKRAQEKESSIKENEPIYSESPKEIEEVKTLSQELSRPEPIIHQSYQSKSKASPLLIDSSSSTILNEKEDFAISTAGRTVTQRQKAIIQQKVYNGDYTHYQLPPPNLLTPAKIINQPSLKNDLRKQAEVLEDTLLSFGIEAKVGEIHCGPTIVSFEVHPATGVKVQKIKALENDIALNLQAKSIRIIAPIPGKAVVGIEVPAQEAQEVNFKDILEDYRSSQRNFHIPVLLGKTVNGEHVITDLVRMPHCIIAGATGTGKSVCINTIVMSLLMNCKPDEVKLMLVDPKKVELYPYTRLPHLISPVITEPAGVTSALKWLVREMEKRYEMLKVLGFRNIAAFNNRKINKEAEEEIDMEIPTSMYYIVCIIDELADLMMLSSNEIEMPIARIAQMARAVGIHLILATQRPSREVITGLIKANFPTRVSFKVASRVNSQIILDEIGAESLLGNGDMLFMPPGASTLIRTQGCFIRDQDIHKVVKSICEQAPPNYLIDSFDKPDPTSDDLDLFSDTDYGPNEDMDPLYNQALNLVVKTGSISTTFLQRKLKIGYARAASIMDQLEDQGMISAQDGAKPRKLLVSPKDAEEEGLPYSDS